MHTPFLPSRHPNFAGLSSAEQAWPASYEMLAVLVYPTSNSDLTFFWQLIDAVTWRYNL